MPLKTGTLRGFLDSADENIILEGPTGRTRRIVTSVFLRAKAEAITATLKVVRGTVQVRTEEHVVSPEFDLAADETVEGDERPAILEAGDILVIDLDAAPTASEPEDLPEWCVQWVDES